MLTVNLTVKNLEKNNADAFEMVAGGMHGVIKVDTWPGRTELGVEDGADTNRIVNDLRAAGFNITEPSHSTVVVHPSPTPHEGIVRCAIDGMHCRSCEITIERRFRKIAGVESVDVDAAKGIAVIKYTGTEPTLTSFQEAVREDGYTVRGNVSKMAAKAATNTALDRRPSFWQLVGLFALVLFIGSILSRFGIFKSSIGVGAVVGVGAAFLIGLVAASSSCIAVSGGLLLSTAAKYNERFGNLRTFARMKPVIFFVAGRVVAYTILGGIIGLVGNALTPSPVVTGSIAVLAACYMLIMGLDMLHIAPAWLKRFIPRMPKFISRRVLNVEESVHPAAPMMMGAATFLLPCGFTQALQLYALTTGSFVRSALILGAFSLGTAPALLALGWASSSLKGKAGRFFFRFSGALVVVLGLWNIQNGLTIAGYPLSFPSISFGADSAAAAQANDPNVTFDGTTQVIRMAVTSDGGYAPSSSFTIKAGVPVRWEVDGTDAAGCRSVLMSRQLGIQKLLARGENIIEFTAPQPGTYPFSCSMGMYRGTITAVAGI